MPWLGDGTWVEDANLARAIVNGRTNYVPWSGDVSNLETRPAPSQDDADDDE